MPPLVPLKRRELIRALRQLGFDGPFPGGNHQYMCNEQLMVRIPNPHRGDISKGLLVKILAEAGISREEWESI